MPHRSKFVTFRDAEKHPTLTRSRTFLILCVLHALHFVSCLSSCFTSPSCSHKVHRFILPEITTTYISQTWLAKRSLSFSCLQNGVPSSSNREVIFSRCFLSSCAFIPFAVYDNVHLFFDECLGLRVEDPATGQLVLAHCTAATGDVVGVRAYFLLSSKFR